jgi:hypothetical protein
VEEGNQLKGELVDVPGIISFVATTAESTSPANCPSRFLREQCRHRDRREEDDARPDDRGAAAPAAGKRRAEMEAKE